MIKVHAWMLSLNPTVEGSQRYEDPKHPVFYDQGRKCFVSSVPEFITKTIGGATECTGSDADKAIGGIYKRYKEYEEKIAPTTRVKIIRYTLNMFGARYEFDKNGIITSCKFRHGGYQCGESKDQRNLKIEITWDIGWWITQGKNNWYSHNPDARTGGSFDSEGGQHTGTWMYWTKEREEFFRNLSERMLDLIELISNFFNDTNGSVGGGAIRGGDVAKKIDSGAFVFPRLPAPKEEKP